MNSNTNDFLNLKGTLKARLDLIVNSIPRYWDYCPHYSHFTNHNVTHSERVHRLLAYLAQELPLDHQLTEDEVFIVGASAYLYEIGFQSPYVESALSSRLQKGSTLSSAQLAEVAQQKHRLSEELLMRSARGEEPSLNLGLHADDDYTRLIAAVCRGISDESLGNVSEMQPVRGVPVRTRLLVALLRLADELYIDRERVDLEKLKAANLPLQRTARWWAYHYIQTLPIERGEIRFHYFLPFHQREYLGHLRALIEPRFDYRNNPIMSWLLDKYNLRLVSPNRPSLGRYDQAAPGLGFQNPMPAELVAYLRAEVTPIPTKDTPDSLPVPSEMGICVLALDYENLITQLGLEGYFATPDQVSRFLTRLRNQAVTEYGGSIHAVAIGHWDRAFLRDAAKTLDKWIYELVVIAPNEDVPEKLEAALREVESRHSDKRKGVARVIFVAPRAEMARRIISLAERKVGVSTWITETPDASIYQGGLGVSYSYLNRILELEGPQPLEKAEFEVCELASILRLLDSRKPTGRSQSLNDVQSKLATVERLNGRGEWWMQWLFQEDILIEDQKVDGNCTLNTSHPKVGLVQVGRAHVIETLASLSGEDQGIGEDALLLELRTRDSSLFRRDAFAQSFLELLKDEEVVFRDIHNSKAATWQLNPSIAAINRSHEYVGPFVVAFDSILLRDGHFDLHEHRILQLLNPYLGLGITEPVYDTAIERGWVKRRVTDEPLRNGRGTIVVVTLNEMMPDVAVMLRNRNIIVNQLQLKSLEAGVERNSLWDRVRRVNSFSLDKRGFDGLVGLLSQDHIVELSPHDSDPGRDGIVLQLKSTVTQRLIGRMNLYGLVRILRRLRAYDADSSKTTDEVMRPLVQYETRNSEAAKWTLEFARDIGLIVTPEGRGREARELEISRMYLARHAFVARLDDRQDKVCNALVGLVEKLAANTKDSWVPRPVLLSEMDKDLKYGYSREEQEYWLDQAIYRLHVLMIERRPGPRGEVPCVKVCR